MYFCVETTMTTNKKSTEMTIYINNFFFFQNFAQISSFYCFFLLWMNKQLARANMINFLTFVFFDIQTKKKKKRNDLHFRRQEEQQTIKKKRLEGIQYNIIVNYTVYRYFFLLNKSWLQWFIDINYYGYTDIGTYICREV